MKTEVVLMILLGGVKIGQGTDLGHDFLSAEDFFAADFCDNFFGCPPLGIVVVEDH